MESMLERLLKSSTQNNTKRKKSNRKLSSVDRPLDSCGAYHTRSIPPPPLHYSLSHLSPILFTPILDSSAADSSKMPKEIGDSTDKHSKTCVVLGGRGFIGRALVERLLKLGNWIVRVADSHKSPELKPTEPLLTDAIASGRAAYFQVDVRDKSQIVEALRGVSVVFFTDSMDLFPQDFYLCYKVIVQGAKNVVKACRECGVKRLIHSSSADVVFDDVHDICGGDESLPYSGQFWDMVADLRTQAEALILSANGADDLLTCALRPCNVFGPGDPQLMPLLVNMAKSNWDKFIIGSGNNVSDFTYVDNVAHAHICAEESLSARIDTVSGKAFFITNLEPMKFREFAFLFLDRLGHPSTPLKALQHRYVTLLPYRVSDTYPILIRDGYTDDTYPGRIRELVPTPDSRLRRHCDDDDDPRPRGCSKVLDIVLSLPLLELSISAVVACSDIWTTSCADGFISLVPFFNIPPLVAEHIFSLIKLLHRKSDFKKLDPSISIYKLASCTRTFSCLAAQKHINYSPVVSLKEAMTLTVDSFSDLAIEPVFMRYRCSDEPSKIEKLLGGGQVADILLWRDERKTFICFALLGFMYYWFFLSGNTFVSSLAQLLLLTIILLCGHHVLQLSGYGSTVLRLPPSCFEISEVNVRSFFFAMKCMWDKVECLIKSLAQGEDWLIFFKVASFMYVFKWIVSQYLVHAIGLALVFVFSVCFVYEQYEEKIDEIAVIIYMIASKLTILLASKLPKPNSSYNPLTEKGSNRSLLDDRQ
ncbi:hypothetical protein SASPL_146148 [Salvia splendens]|uniref:Reticulon-like protein n=1 Tax=Salvia splendens TaxID=180675 RepID=A0A8X8Z8P3_SALSN|nr:hypothetical protein SASPL_146148 [Salvia splendens]